MQKSLCEQFILNDIEHKKLFYDSKTILQEIVQRDCKEEAIQYVIIGEEGPDHAKRFVVEVRMRREESRDRKGQHQKGSGAGGGLPALS